MADSVLISLNRDLERYESDIERARQAIKAIETKRRQENLLWDRDVDTLERKIETLEQRRRDIRRQVEKRNDEIARSTPKAANDNGTPTKRASGFW